MNDELQVERNKHKVTAYRTRYPYPLGSLSFGDTVKDEDKLPEIAQAIDKNAMLSLMFMRLLFMRL